MDQQLVNNQITSMRKKVKLAKTHVYQKLFKQINIIKKRIDKWKAMSGVDNAIIQKQLEELNKKLKSKQNDAAELKTIKPDTISKAALIHEQDYFSSIMNNTNISSTDKLVGLVCRDKLIQSMAEKFKKDNPDCDKWLPIQIELWEHKRSFKGKNKKKAKILKNKINADNMNNVSNKQNKIGNKSVVNVEQKLEMDFKTSPKSVQVNIAPKIVQTLKTPSKSIHESTPTKSVQAKTPKVSKSSTKTPKVYTPKFNISKIESKDESNETLSNMNGDQSNQVDIQIKTSSKKALIKRINLNTSNKMDKIFDDDQEKSIENNNNDTNERKVKRMKADEFFLAADDNQDDNEHPDIIKLKQIEKPNVIPKQTNKFHSNSFSKSPKFGKDFKNFNQNFKNQSFNRTPRRYFNVDNETKQSGSKDPKTNTESLHPSWKAKIQANSKERVSLGSAKSKPNTHIKFD